MRLDRLLSTGLADLARSVRSIAHRDRKPDPELLRMADELALSAELSSAMELELAVFRQLEAGRSGRLSIEIASTEAVLPTSREDNVITPDFGGRS